MWNYHLNYLFFDFHAIFPQRLSNYFSFFAVAFAVVIVVVVVAQVRL